MRMSSRIRCCRICPLPLWERATQWFSEDEGVRGPLLIHVRIKIGGRLGLLPPPQAGEGWGGGEHVR
jgi:hypothetical protein